VIWGSGSYRTDFAYDGRDRLRTRREHYWTGHIGQLRTAVGTGGQSTENLDGQERTSANTPTVSYARGQDLSGTIGAGKTTFAREFLPKDARVVHFVNADLIAGGLSPLQPEAAAVTAGRIFLAELDRLARGRVDFAFETTLSGLVYCSGRIPTADGS
jgi:hypothetical protein